MLTRILVSSYSIRTLSFGALSSAGFAALFILMAYAGVAAPWWVLAITIPVGGAILGVALASATRGLAEQYGAALGDTAAGADKARAIRASIRGPFPREGDVLMASRRLAHLSVRLYQRIGQWTVIGSWCCAVAFTALGVIPGIVSTGAPASTIAVLCLLGVAFAGFAVWIQVDRRRAMRRATRLELESVFKTVTL